MERSYKVVVIPHPNAYALEDEGRKRLKNNFYAEYLKQIHA